MLRRESLLLRMGAEVRYTNVLKRSTYVSKHMRTGAQTNRTTCTTKHIWDQISRLVIQYYSAKRQSEDRSARPVLRQSGLDVRIHSLEAIQAQKS